jgi:hypothetical protein
MSTRPTLPEPVTVDRFWRNRRHEAITTTLKTFEGRNICDVRLHVMEAGRLIPTGKGVAVVIPRLPDLVKALTKALKRAQALGLLDGEESGE